MQPGQSSAQWILRGLSCVLGLSVCACGKNGGAKPVGQDAVLVDFAAQIVIPTYQLFETRATALRAATEIFTGARTPANLEALRLAWVGARSPWEQSEAFLFGPVEAYSFDAAVDSWPLNHTDLASVLSSSAEFTADLVDSRLAPTEKGFHAIEYMIYGENSQKKATAFTDRELSYTKAAADNLAKVAHQLVVSWRDGIDGHPPFAAVFAGAGAEDNTSYASITAAREQIIAGMEAICTEVADTKIGAPFVEQNPNKVESQFSYNSLADFADNLRSVQNAYTGTVPASATAGTPLAGIIQASDVNLDAQVRQEIQMAIDAINQIPGPFPVKMLDKANAAAITAAQTAIVKLQATLHDQVAPLLAKAGT